MVLVRLEPVALAWILLLPVIAGSVFADAFDWLPVRRRWLQLTLVLGASVLIGILVIPCVLVAIGGSAAVGQIENKHFGLVLIGGATIAVTVVPLIVTVWLAWLIDAPPLSRHAALPRRISLTALALMALIGGFLSTDMLREEIAVTRETAARYQQMDDERAAMTRAGSPTRSARCAGPERIPTTTPTLIDGLRSASRPRSRFRRKWWKTPGSI